MNTKDIYKNRKLQRTLSNIIHKDVFDLTAFLAQPINCESQIDGQKGEVTIFVDFKVNADNVTVLQNLFKAYDFNIKFKVNRLI